ncbi:MAG TPA: DUF3025 domain-containing protein [Burkholderiales bacterium]|nr:DUF3025 domain-containing protein [Burkholderiales bacterium]
MPDIWNTDWLTRGEMFVPLRPVAAGLPAIGWPDLDLLNALAEGQGRRIVNAQGLRVRFVPQAPKSKSFEAAFEPRTYLKGEVQVRAFDWHDLFNALVWMTFPATKAVINARHYESMAAAARGNRPPLRDALTLFDEDGVAVVSTDAELLDLVRGFRWKELFWQRRDAVEARMCFCVFGHAFFSKALRPFVGLTGKAVLLQVPGALLEMAKAAQLAELDRLLATHIRNRERFCHGRELFPLPVLGVPGWWSGNEREEFYDDTAYFRPGRRQPTVSSR